MMASEVSISTATSRRGMVAAAHPEAATIGAKILAEGGNAFDAAVAVAFALGVCEPHASSVGGGGFMTAHCAAQSKDTFVDFREVAPASATPSMWQVDEKGAVIGNKKAESGTSICIPGEVAGMCYILEHYGTMTLAEVLKPVIELCERGFTITPALMADINSNREKLSRYVEEGNPFLAHEQAGEILKNPQLAKTLKRIAEGGAEVFYNSDLTDEIIASANRWGGDLTREDFRNFSVQEYEPIRGSYRGYDILSSPPPSSGGTHVIEALNMLEQVDVSALEYHSKEHLHLLSEVLKMCFADRVKYMGDPKFVKLPLHGLTSKEYARERMMQYNLETVSDAKCGNPFDFESSETTHFTVTDAQGNVVCITKTVSAFFGSGVVPANLGFVLNCQMRGFALGEGKSNSVGGGKKPLSSMSPTILMKDGQAVCGVGTPGATRIITTAVQVISNLIDFQMTLEQAIDAPRCYNDVDNCFQYEERINGCVLEELGQKTKQRPAYDRFFGGVHGVEYCGKKRLMIGVADPRRDGRAIGSDDMIGTTL